MSVAVLISITDVSSAFTSWLTGAFDILAFFELGIVICSFSYNLFYCKSDVIGLITVFDAILTGRQTGLK